MSTADYLDSVDYTSELRLNPDCVDRLDSPWEPALAETMRRIGIPAFEEALLPALIEDLCRR